MATRKTAAKAPAAKATKPAAKAESKTATAAPKRAAPACIKPVRAEREHPEKRAEHILALGDPRDGLHVQRMHGKQRRHGRTRPKRPR